MAIIADIASIGTAVAIVLFSLWMLKQLFTGKWCKSYNKKPASAGFLFAATAAWWPRTCRGSRCSPPACQAICLYHPTVIG